MIIAEKDMYKLLRQISLDPTAYFKNLDQKYDGDVSKDTVKITFILKELKNRNFINGISRFTTKGRPIHNEIENTYITPEGGEFIKKIKNSKFKFFIIIPSAFGILSFLIAILGFISDFSASNFFSNISKIMKIFGL